MLLPLSTLRLKSRGLWKQEDDHGNQFMVRVTSAPHTCGFQFLWLSDIQNASVQLVSKARKWEWAALNEPRCHGQVHEPLPTLFLLLQEAGGLSPSLQRKL